MGEFCGECGNKLNINDKFCGECGTKVSDSNFIHKSNPDLALKLFRSLSVGYDLDEKEQKQIDYILKKCQTKQDVLNKVIELCGDPKTPKQRYIYAMAYGWSNKEYRRKAIYYIEYYLNNNLYEEIYLTHFRDMHSTIQERRKEHISSMQCMLIQLYIKEYEFLKALELVEDYITFVPTDPLVYRKKVDILIKTNKIDDAIKFLKDFKKCEYYRDYDEYTPKTWMKDTINELLLECINKKDSNYIYKQKKQKICYVK